MPCKVETVVGEWRYELLANKFHRLLNAEVSVASYRIVRSCDYERNAREDCNGRPSRGRCLVVLGGTTGETIGGGCRDFSGSEKREWQITDLSFFKGSYSCQWSSFFFLFSLLLPFFPFFPRAREDCTIHAIPVGGEIYRGGYPANGLMDSPFIRDLDYQFARRPRDFYGRLRVPFNCFIRSSFGSYDPIYVSRLMNLKYDCMHTRRKDLLKDLDRWLRSWSRCF